MIGVIFGNGPQMINALQMGFCIGLIALYAARMFIVHWKWFWIAAGVVALVMWGAAKTVLGIIATIGTALVAGNVYCLFKIAFIAGALLALELPCLSVRTLFVFGGKKKQPEQVAVVKAGGQQ